MKNVLIAIVLSIVLALAAMFLPDSIKMQVLIVLLPALIFVPKINIVHEFLKYMMRIIQVIHQSKHR